MSGYILLARRGGREAVSGGSLAFGQKRGDWLEAWKKIYQKGGGPRIVGLFLAKDGGSHCSLFLIKRIGLGFLFALYFYL
jgi:hypothetical protein